MSLKIGGASLFFLSLGLTGCTSAYLAGGPTRDVGTIAVSGLESGFGAHAEAGLFKSHETSVQLVLGVEALRSSRR